MAEKIKSTQALFIRPVRTDDCEDIWTWRNDPKVRKFMFSQAEITLPEHRDWFDKKLKNKDAVMYLFEDHQGAKVGQVRFEIMPEGMASISVNMNPKYIGQGFGAHVIAEATRTLFKENPMLVSVEADVLADNIISRKVFQKAGYLLQGQNLKQGKEICVFVIKRN